jgi:hypothetical protein
MTATTKPSGSDRSVPRLEGGKHATNRWTRMTQRATVALGLGMTVTVAWGGEQWGTVKSVDQSQNRIVLSDGTRFWLMPGLSLDLLARGKRVKIVYDEREGQKWIRSVEATN